MRKLERLFHLAAQFPARPGRIRQALPQPLGFDLELRGFGGEHVLIQTSGQIAIQQPLLHLLDIGQSLADGSLLLLPHPHLVVAHLHQALLQPLPALGIGDAHLHQFAVDGIFELVLPPADHRVVGSRIEVPAAVVDVLVDLTALHPPDDALPGDAKAAVGAHEHAAGEVMIRIPHAAVLALQQVLAPLEDLQVNDGFVLTGVGLPAERDHPDVEAVVEDVRQRRAVETRIARLVGVAFALQYVGDLLEGVIPAGVELENALHGNRVDRVGLDGLFLVARHVLVTVGRQARRPSLADLLLDAFEHLGAEIVGVVLRHRRHDVERQGAGCTGAKLVLHEREFDPAGVLQLLEPHGIAHIAAGAVELVGQDEVDLELAGVGLHPLEHLVEDHPLGPALGGFGDHELAQDRPALSCGLVAGDAELGVDGVAFPLLA